MERCGDAFARYPERPDLWADWWYRRCGDHLVTGKNRGRAQLGLSLLLVARCDFHALRTRESRLPRRSEELARMAFARDRRDPVANADALWRERRAPSRRMGSAVVARLRKLRAGAHRQCRDA